MAFHYNVRPRYTAGSRARVHQGTAFQQADNEHKHYEIALQGVYGEKEQERAKQLGLGPVVEADGLRYSPAELVIEHSNHWFVRCLITDETWVRPFAWIDLSKTTNCKRCRAEHEKAEFKALREETRPWRSQAAREAKLGHDDGTAGYGTGFERSV